MIEGGQRGETGRRRGGTAVVSVVLSIHLHGDQQQTDQQKDRSHSSREGRHDERGREERGKRREKRRGREEKRRKRSEVRSAAVVLVSV